MIRPPATKAVAPARFSADRLKLDCGREAERIEAWIREHVRRRFKKKGVVVALSGGIDSSVVGALAVRALGPDRVLGLLMPEKDSAPQTLPLSRLAAEHFGIPVVQEDITGILNAVGCYERRDRTIKQIIPEYGPGWKAKLVLPNLLESGIYRVFSVVAQSPTGQTVEKRVTLEAYLGIVAATNFKQRTRKMLEYYHADRLNYAVAGTPNRLEHDLGFFVRNGDGSADIKPIAHLYKTQVYQLAEYLQLPDSIREQTPTTDTYSFYQTQEEFYFSVPHQKLDLILCGKEEGATAAEIGLAVQLTAAEVARVWSDIEAKRRMATCLHAAPEIIKTETLAV